MRWWRYAGGGPIYVKMGSKVRYRVEDLEAFIEASLRRNTGQAGAEELASSAKTRP